MRKNKITWIIILLLIITIAVMSLPRSTGASNGLPSNLYEWTRADGSLCSAIVMPYGSAIDCDCPCSGCAEEFSPTDDPQVTSTAKSPEPTPTPEPECRIWLCHKPNTSAEQNYCCWDSEGCKNAHLKHGDYLGKCK